MARFSSLLLSVGCVALCAVVASAQYFFDDEFDVMSVYAPYALDDSDYFVSEFDIMAGKGGQDFQPAPQEPVRLPAKFESLPDITLDMRNMPDETQQEFVDTTTVKPNFVDQPTVVEKYMEQPIHRVRRVHQPVMKRFIKQKVIRPRIIRQTDYRPSIMEQPIIIPHYYDRTETDEQYQSSNKAAPDITLDPVIEKRETRAAPRYGTLPPKYGQPIYENVAPQAPVQTKKSSPQMFSMPGNIGGGAAINPFAGSMRV